MRAGCPWERRPGRQVCVEVQNRRHPRPLVCGLTPMACSMLDARRRRALDRSFGPLKCRDAPGAEDRAANSPLDPSSETWPHFAAYGRAKSAHLPIQGIECQVRRPPGTSRVLRQRPPQSPYCRFFGFFGL